jgi:beta-glucosidase
MNTGERAGKEVAQLYASAPQSGLNKERQRLIAFVKTKELAPGESESLTLRFDLADCASYDERRAAWVLEAGDYLLRLGSSSRDNAIAAAIRVPAEIVTRQCRSCCAPDFSFERLTGPETVWEELPEGVPVLSADPAAFETETVDYTLPPFEETERERALLDRLSPEEQLQLTLGGDIMGTAEGAFEVPGAAGKTAISLIGKGIPNVVFCDGPAGVNVVKRCFLLPDGRETAAEVPERYQWGPIGKMAKQQLAAMKGEIIHRYATAWPVEMLLAQTWNTALLREIGQAVGAEMKAFGVSVWLAPGMNIHRNPLGGRSFEYYSEDPVLSGEMAAALSLGVQSHGGVGVSVKHFCCNNAEDNRNGVSANVSERALREIYLKGFEIAVKKARPMTVMSSYNRLNRVYTANRGDLLNDILRCEWGFDGLVMTDWGSTNDKAADPTACAVAGNDLIMPGNPYDREQLKKALDEGRLDMTAVRTAAARVLRLVLSTLPGKE